MGSASCRLYVLLARSAPVAVIFRRGPSKWVQLVKWHTDRDEFEAGQWFHGRLYERRCDLSPDGSLLIYFASKQSTRQRQSEVTATWTAISRPPYLTALALWPKGDCWDGGGLFETNRSVWLNHHPMFSAHHPKHPPRGLRVTLNPHVRGEDDPIWSKRMERDGWALIQKGVFWALIQKRVVEPDSHWNLRAKQREVWERVGPDGDTRLVQSLNALDFDAFGGPYIESFTLERPGQPDLPIPDARWADWDQSGRLVFARGGKIFSGEIQSGRLLEAELVDLNPNAPHPVEAPKWALRWP